MKQHTVKIISIQHITHNVLKIVTEKPPNYNFTSGQATISKLALFGAAPIWTQRDDFQFNLPKSAVDDLIELNYKDRPKLLSNFAKIFSATETSLNEGIEVWLTGINLSASSYATDQCLIALRDTDLRADKICWKIS